MQDMWQRRAYDMLGQWARWMVYEGGYTHEQIQREFAEVVKAVLTESSDFLDELKAELAELALKPPSPHAIDVQAVIDQYNESLRPKPAAVIPPGFTAEEWRTAEAFAATFPKDERTTEQRRQDEVSEAYGDTANIPRKD
jgi:hypothetical protein